MEIEQRLSKSALAAAANSFSTEGEDPTVSGGVKRKITF